MSLGYIEKGVHLRSDGEPDNFDSDHVMSPPDTLETIFWPGRDAAIVGDPVHDSAGAVDFDMQDAAPAEPPLGYDCRICARQFKRQDARRKHEWNKHQLADTKPAPRRRGAAKLREARLSEDHRNPMPNSFGENSYIDPVFGGGA
jgi:hypothetical protein